MNKELAKDRLEMKLQEEQLKLRHNYYSHPSYHGTKYSFIGGNKTRRDKSRRKHKHYSKRT